MATYIQGLTDYIPQIQPFQPDLNFYGNVMQTRQSRYDAAKKKVSDLYGSLLYAPLTGDNNIKRRDEFFKFIDNDIKRISGLDLSLQQNQDAAMEIFRGFYDDKDMVNDMVWTRNYNNAVQKHEAMKNCFDPAKCGGQAWDDGYMELVYKREDFKRATDAERLNFETPTYTPYYNWQADAVKAAKDKGYKVTKDTITGDYKVTKQNGELLAGGLASVFRDVYGNDPRVEANYKTKAYVIRKNTVRSDIDLYGSEEASNMAYLTKVTNQGLASLHKDLEKYSADYNSTDKRIQQLQSDIDAKGGTPEELKALEEAYAAKESLQATKDYLEKSINSIKANAESGNIRVLESRADNAKAQTLLRDDLVSVAKDIAYTQDVVLQKIEEAPFAAIKKNLEADLVREKWKFKYRVDEAGIKFDYDKQLKLMDRETELMKLGIKTAASGKQGSPTIEDYSYQEAVAGGVSELNVKDHPALAYDMHMDEWRELEAKALSSAAKFNYEAFQKAKKAQDASYLDQVYGKGKWEKVNSPESYAAMLNDTKVSSSNVFNRTMNYFKTKTNNIKWGEDLLTTNAKQIAAIQNDQAAADGTLRHNMNSMNKIADEMKNKVVINPLYRYVDEMFHPGYKGARGQFFQNNGEAPYKFMKKYMEENRASRAEAQQAYKLLHDELFSIYNSESNKDASVHTGIGLGGEGNIQGAQISTSVDPSERGANSFNMYTRDLLTKVTRDEGNSFVGLGNNTKATYEDAVKNKAANATLKAILADFIHNIDASGDIANKDEKKDFYNISAGVIGGETKENAYLKIQLPQSYIEKRAGKDKMITPELAQQLYYNPVIIFHDKKAIKSKFVERASDTPLQRNLATNGSADISAYSNISSIGPINIDYDKSKDKVTYSGTFKQRNIDGTWKTVYKEYKPTSLGEANSQYDNVINDLEALKSYNLKMMAQERELYKRKQQ